MTVKELKKLIKKTKSKEAKKILKEESVILSNELILYNNEFYTPEEFANKFIYNAPCKFPGWEEFIKKYE